MSENNEDSKKPSPIEEIPARSIMQKVRYDGSQWFGIDYNMNLYRGCCHGCIYCDSRSECYRVEDFDTVRVKKDALAILRRELWSRRKKGVVGIGAMSDSYNPFEKKLEVTRGALELLHEYGFGVSLETKSSLVTRDIDLFQKIAAKHSAIVKLTITCADDELAHLIEPHAASSSRRFAAMHELSAAGVFCGMLMMPILPFINDTEENVRSLVESAYESGAAFIYPSMGVTMRDRQRDHFMERVIEVDQDLPDRYRQAFGDRYSCTSPKSRELRALFKKLCEERGLLYRMPDIIKAYKREQEESYQPSLF